MVQEDIHNLLQPCYSGLAYSTDDELNDFIKSGFDDEIIEFKDPADMEEYSVPDDTFPYQHDGNVPRSQFCPTYDQMHPSSHSHSLTSTSCYQHRPQAYQRQFGPPRSASPKAHFARGPSPPPSPSVGYLPRFMRQTQMHYSYPTASPAPPLLPPPLPAPQQPPPQLMARPSRRLVRRTQIVEEFEEIPSQHSIVSPSLPPQHTPPPPPRPYSPGHGLQEPRFYQRRA